MTAGWQKVFHADPKIGFLAAANKYQAALDKGELLAPAKSIGQMQQIILNNQIDAGMAALFIFLVVSILFFAVPACLRALGRKERSDCETPYESMPAGASV